VGEEDGDGVSQVLHGRYALPTAAQLAAQNSLSRQKSDSQREAAAAACLPGTPPTPSRKREHVKPMLDMYGVGVSEQLPHAGAAGGGAGGVAVVAHTMPG